jgi:hypothetical protein
MIHEDYERISLQDRIFLAEEQAELEKEYYLYLSKNVNHDNNGETATIIGERIGYESLFANTLPSEWDRCKQATVRAEDIQLDDNVSKKRDSYSH